jgi:hypothetical protein
MLQTAAQASTVLASLTIIFAVIAYRREIRGQNLAGLFYLHQYLAKDSFAEARRISLASRLTQTLTGSQYFPNFERLHEMAKAIHRIDGPAEHAVAVVDRSSTTSRSTSRCSTRG